MAVGLVGWWPVLFCCIPADSVFLFIWSWEWGLGNTRDKEEIIHREENVIRKLALNSRPPALWSLSTKTSPNWHQDYRSTVEICITPYQILHCFKFNYKKLSHTKLLVNTFNFVCYLQVKTNMNKLNLTYLKSSTVFYSGRILFKIPV